MATFSLRVRRGEDWTMAFDVSTSQQSPELGPEHFGKWVAVRGAEVVAFAEDYKELVQDARVRCEDDVFFVAESML